MTRDTLTAPALRHPSARPWRTSRGYVYRNRGRRVWMMKYYENGRPIRKTTGTYDEAEARAQLHAATNGGPQ
jgi:hypothetical protein